MIKIKTLREFDKGIYACKRGIRNKAKWVASILFACGNETYNPDDVEPDAWCKNLFNNDELSSQMINLTADNIDESNLISFFNNHLNKNKIDSLFKHLELTSFEKRDFLSMCYAIAMQYIQYVKYRLEECEDVIATSYQYALDNPNTFIKNSIKPEYSLLISEQGNHCPLTGGLLTYNNGVSVCKAVQIYPENLPTDKKIYFDKIKRAPSDFNDVDNLIMLGIYEANTYEKFLSVETYEKLIKAKKSYNQLSNLQSEISTANHQKMIGDVVEYLLIREYSNDDIKLLQDTKKISEKIHPNEHYYLYEQVKMLVQQNYNYLSSFFRAFEDKTINGSTSFAKFIKDSSDNLIKSKLTQEQVFDHLSTSLYSFLPNEIQEKAPKVVCEIIVAFFVQHCEVFSYGIS